MLFLGLDTGYARLGVGIIQKDKTQNQPQLVYSALIETSSQANEAERLVEVEAKLSQVLEKKIIQSCAVEQFFFKKDITTGVQLLQTRGVLLLTLQKHNIPIISISPSRLKKMITGYGKANKLQIQTMIKKILKLEELPKPDDLADALGLSLCAWLGSANINQS